MVIEDITTGINAIQFGPDLRLDQAQMITFLWRQEGEPTGFADDGFIGGPGDSIYELAVAWAKAEGITRGASLTTFSPAENVTRGQLVTLLWRRSGKPGGWPDPGFSDVPAGEYFTVSGAWAKVNNVTQGTSITTFSPNDPVTRGQAAAFLFREASAALA